MSFPGGYNLLKGIVIVFIHKYHHQIIDLSWGFFKNL